MFLKEKNTDHMVEVLKTEELFDPFQTRVTGRYNTGEELPDPGPFDKGTLVFLSGEPLPRCWVDPHYREAG